MIVMKATARSIMVKNMPVSKLDAIGTASAGRTCSAARATPVLTVSTALAGASRTAVAIVSMGWAVSEAGSVIDPSATAKMAAKAVIATSNMAATMDVAFILKAGIGARPGGCSAVICVYSLLG